MKNNWHLAMQISNSFPSRFVPKVLSSKKIRKILDGNKQSKKYSEGKIWHMEISKKFSYADRAKRSEAKGMIVKMKIEKLTENKIRVILKQNDFIDRNINIQNLVLTEPNYNNLFLDILRQAKEEVNFDWSGHKLIIELFSESDDIFVFTITKYLDSKKYLYIKKKDSKIINKCTTYKFQTFEHFCEFCNFLSTFNLEFKKMFKTSFLYFYNNEYYLTIKAIDTENINLHIFNFCLLEFATLVNSSEHFYLKLEEHAKKIFKNNAIHYGIKFFAEQKNHN